MSAVCLHSRSRHIALLSPLPPRAGWRRLARRFHKRWVILLACYFFTPPEDNINWVFGWGNEPQTVLPSGLYLALVLGIAPLGVYWPTWRGYCRWSPQMVESSTSASSILKAGVQHETSKPEA